MSTDGDGTISSVLLDANSENRIIKTTDKNPEMVSLKITGDSHSKIAKRHDKFVIELGLFIDDALWIHFQKLHKTEAESALKAYSHAIVSNINALFRHRSIQLSIQFVVNYYEVMKVPPVSGIVKKFAWQWQCDSLIRFVLCLSEQIESEQYKNQAMGPRSAFYRASHLYDLYDGKLRTVAGFAPVRGMCSEKRSCTISEGLDFSAVFVTAHEMGHSLGMHHDEDIGCNKSCCIMSSSVGAGRTLWSPCSARELNNFITQLDQSENCLRTMHTTKNIPQDDGIRAGQMYSLDEQCTIFHGTCWRHELKRGQHINDVCKMVWCGNGEGIIRSAHPALEYSYCGHQMWCIEGQCIPAGPNEMIQQQGGWSGWIDEKSDHCPSECVRCQIDGQIRVRRSTRICNNPFPNNGGAFCHGDDARGIRCQKEICNGSSVEQFATEYCAKQRDAGSPSAVNLTGQGMQYSGDPCKIWCLLLGQHIRTFAIFPDGTPCGIKRYCVKGRCVNLNCGERALVGSLAHCPYNSGIQKQTKNSRNHAKISFNSIKKNPYQLYTEWTTWSECTAALCEQQGFRLRKRMCVDKEACRVSQRQRRICYGQCTENDFQWTEWSSCSASCGFGIEHRIRSCQNCTKQHSFINRRPCFLKGCESNPHRVLGNHAIVN